MILFDKTYEQIMEETLTELTGMGISERDAGSVARLFLNVINKRLHQYYKSLKLNHVQAFVSTAEGDFLDKIGVLVDCKRRTGEFDEDYRYRMTKQIQVVASANRIAIRLAALAIDGVQDVMMKRYTHGTGSYSVYVISENPITPQELLDSVQAAIDEVQAFGVRGEVYRPIIQTVEMKTRLIFNKRVPDLERKLAIAQAQDTLKMYVNSRGVGQPLVVDEIKKELRGVHNDIEETIIFNYKINHRPVLNVDQECAWNERFIESDKPNAIMVM